MEKLFSVTGPVAQKNVRNLTLKMYFFSSLTSQLYLTPPRITFVLTSADIKTFLRLTLLKIHFNTDICQLCLQLMDLHHFQLNIVLKIPLIADVFENVTTLHIYSIGLMFKLFTMQCACSHLNCQMNCRIYRPKAAFLR